MQKYIAGISPSAAGFSEITIKPQLGNLKLINSKVNTVAGKIELKVGKSEGEIIDLKTPSRTRVAIEKSGNDMEVYVNGFCAYKDGKSKINFKCKYEEDDENYLYFIVKPGEYIFKVGY